MGDRAVCHERAVLDLEGVLVAADLPAGKVFSVEELSPARFDRPLLDGNRQYEGEKTHGDVHRRESVTPPPHQHLSRSRCITTKRKTGERRREELFFSWVK